MALHIRYKRFYYFASLIVCVYIVIVSGSSNKYLQLIKLNIDKTNLTIYALLLTLYISVEMDYL